MQWHVDIYIQTYIYSHTCHISLCTWCFSRASFRILIIYFMVMAKITTNITKSRRKLFSVLWCSRSNSKSLYFPTIFVCICFADGYKLIEKVGMNCFKGGSNFRVLGGVYPPYLKSGGTSYGSKVSTIACLLYRFYHWLVLKFVCSW